MGYIGRQPGLISSAEELPFDNTGTTLVAEDVNSAVIEVEDAVTAIEVSVGVASGIASLDANGTVPSAQLPSYVDDVIEVPTYADLDVTGEVGKIYVVIADETNGGDTSSFRWSGTAYVLVSNTLSGADVVALLDGEYIANTGTNYIDGNLNTIEDIVDLDTQVKVNADAVIAESLRASTVEGTLADLTTTDQTDLVLAINEVDANTDLVATNLTSTQTSIGSIVDTDGVYVPRVLGDTEYLESNTSIEEDLTDLDTEVKTVQDELDVTQLAVGLDTDGTFIPYTTTNALVGTDVKTSVEAVDIELEATKLELYSMVGQVEDAGYASNESSNYIKGSDFTAATLDLNLNSADLLLDAKIKEVVDTSITNLADKVDKEVNPNTGDPKVLSDINFSDYYAGEVTALKVTNVDVNLTTNHLDIVYSDSSVKSISMDSITTDIHVTGAVLDATTNILTLSSADGGADVTVNLADFVNSTELTTELAVKADKAQDSSTDTVYKDDGTGTTYKMYMLNGSLVLEEL